MIEETQKYYLDKFKQMAINGIILGTPNEIAKVLYIQPNYLRCLLTFLQLDGKIEIIKPKGRIKGIKLKEK